MLNVCTQLNIWRDILCARLNGRLKVVSLSCYYHESAEYLNCTDFYLSQLQLCNSFPSLILSFFFLLKPFSNFVLLVRAGENNKGCPLQLSIFNLHF